MKKNSLHSFGSLADGLLARHKIGKQILSANVVAEAQGLLASFTSEETLPDVKAVSYKDGILLVGCRHSAALYDAEGFAPHLEKQLQEQFPSLSIKVEVRLRPEAFRE